ncbi:MAG: hypothetical protein HY926_09895 [Elusimicrobia bacterium]|nr:hypothetical protein [Elusimicrobiota bacterium]
MKKIFLYGAGVCAAAAVIAAVMMYMKLGSIVKAAVETLGPKVTQTEVRLASVSLSPFSGNGRIKGVFIGNPAGFKTPGAFQMGSVRMAVDLKSLAGDCVVVKEIIVEGPEVTFEGSLKGSNLSRIQKNVESFVPAAPKAKGKKPKKEMKVIVDLFKVTGGKVNLSMTALGGKSLTVPLPDIELKGIGRKSNGATVGEAAQQMFGSLTNAATGAAAGAGHLLKGGTEQIEKAGQAAAGLIKGLFGKKK